MSFHLALRDTTDIVSSISFYALFFANKEVGGNQNGVYYSRSIVNILKFLVPKPEKTGSLKAVV
jgi:hypothetical protein